MFIPSASICNIFRSTRRHPETLPEGLNNLPPAENPLSEREVQVLRLVAQGLSNKEIADRIVVSERTVRAHVSNILNKLHLANRTQAALYAIREGLTDVS